MVENAEIAADWYDAIYTPTLAAIDGLRLGRLYRDARPGICSSFSTATGGMRSPRPAARTSRRPSSRCSATAGGAAGCGCRAAQFVGRRDFVAPALSGTTNCRSWQSALRCSAGMGVAVFVTALVLHMQAVQHRQAALEFPVWPAQGTITSPYGHDGARWHPGIDIGTLRSLRVRAAVPGRVILAGQPRGYEGYGNVVVVRSRRGLTELYGHLARIGGACRRTCRRRPAHRHRRLHRLVHRARICTSRFGAAARR